MRHEVANKSCGALNFKKIPPSMLLDEPTILNQERIGQRSEACKCGIQSASQGSSW
ncbi:MULTISPECIES: hypothetical protein [Candidatus Odyssella]|uniref:hypothetical protein n=1 Tax=Candidatus Odyssella TaxID=84646 RepID=UPI0015849DFA|nr:MULTISPECIES: hypothetical protein [Candidatus Paracaedibacteraceae]